ncbi:MAG: hypothetical protein LBR51_03825 [Bacteroidales bacterium]|jgi:hypothetical protein|nr:hypothetical protein [Bacteroidales bacterium]
MFKVPVLLILYNKVDNTHDLFQILREVQPAKLYVAADGARPHDRLDYVHCLQSRSVILPEWACTKKTFFKEEHLGKARMLLQAMQWFFSQEPEGIVLFDDTLPHLDFFFYCEELLEKYRKDKRVAHISGTNLARCRNKKNDSYYFSAYPQTWGFASWQDRWEGFDLQMSGLDEPVFNQVLEEYVKNPAEKNYWLRRYEILKEHELDIWEYQYIYHVWHLRALSIIPRKNLIMNVGLKTKKRGVRRLAKQAYPILPLVHPQQVERDTESDNHSFKYIYNKAFIKMFADWFNQYLLGKKTV